MSDIQYPERHDYTPISPFKLFVKSNFPFIEATFEGLDNYGLYCKIVEYLNQVIANTNDMQDDVVAFTDFTTDYFQNLDVQEEINNKLDEMVENGTLQTILSPFIISASSPEFVSSTSQMTDHAKNYVLTSSGNIYKYNGTAWADTGYTYGVNENLFSGVTTTVTSTEDLDDCNNAISNRCYVINATDIPNMPVAKIGTLITFNRQATVSGGHCQIYITSLGDEIYFRNRWGTTWHTWKQINYGIENQNTVFSFYPTALNNNSVISDFNSAPANTGYVVNVTSGISNMPTNAKGTLLSFNRQASVSGGYCQIYITEGAELYYRMRWLDFTPWVKIPTLSEFYSQYYTDISLFETIGVIGDSWASGWTYPNGEDQSGANNFPISWPQILARKHGITATNFSSGGLTTKTWLTDTRGLTLLNSETAKKLYMIALGINDATVIDNETMNLGTIDDIDTEDPSNNADTFYGNYGKIVSAVLTKNSDAKIILITIPRTDKATYATLNTAIMAIAELFEIPYITSLDNSLFTSTFFNSTKVNAHPTAGGYSGMANAYSQLMNKCIIDNSSYFIDYYG